MSRRQGCSSRSLLLLSPRCESCLVSRTKRGSRDTAQHMKGSWYLVVRPPGERQLQIAKGLQDEHLCVFCDLPWGAYHKTRSPGFRSIGQTWRPPGMASSWANGRDLNQHRFMGRGELSGMRCAGRRLCGSCVLAISLLTASCGGSSSEVAEPRPQAD